MDDSPAEPEEVPEEVLLLVKPELQPGERLLWASRAGAASPSTAYSPALASWIWFFVFASTSVGCLTAIPWAAGPQPAGKGDPLVILGLVTGTCALLLVIAFLQRIFSQRSERRKLVGQVYALTDRRAMIWVPGVKSTVAVHTFQRGTIRGEDLHRIQYPNGSGDFSFRASHRLPRASLASPRSVGSRNWSGGSWSSRVKAPTASWNQT
jgi:hypothetical protein